MSSESLPVEFLTTTQVTDKGQLTVPSQYRDAMQLEKGAHVAVLRLGGALLLIPEHITSASFVTVSQASVVNLEANLGITEEDRCYPHRSELDSVCSSAIITNSPSLQKSSEVRCQQVRSELRRSRLSIDASTFDGPNSVGVTCA